MQDDGLKIVDFSEYCKTCVNKDKKEDKEPCCDCLGEAVNVNSHKPVRYEQRR